jgi:hypothetical protein
MRKVVAAAVIAASAATSACGRSHDEDPGPQVSHNYQVGNSQEVEVAGPFDVTIHTGAAPTVQAKGNQKLIERLVVEVKGNKLLIHPKEKHGWFGSWGSVRGKGEIAVTVPMIQAATLAGAGDLKLGSVEVGSLKIGIAGAGGATAGPGKAGSAEYQIAGSGDVDARSVQVEDLKVSIAGSGSIKAHASRAADVNIMGSGSVDVTGGAKCSVSKAGAGDVHCA